LLDNIDKKFYLKNTLFIKFKSLYRKNIFLKLLAKLQGISLSYDNIHLYKIFSKLDKIEIEKNIEEDEIEPILNQIGELSKKSRFLSKEYLLIYKNIESIFLQPTSSITIHPFTFLTTYNDFKDTILYKKNKIPKFFMQHGNYIQENIFLKYNEIYPADINFVFNDYTKKFFEKRGAKRVYSVGSENFNYKIENRKNIKYDFLYIAYCTNYAYSGMQVFVEDNRLSIDGNDIHLRHKSIIELFGKKLTDKRLCIKLQYGIVSKNMNYIPLLELSKKYKNIKIEFIEPLSNLFNNSKYIISDYISSEFINRELLYKKDIFLFKNTFPIPKDILTDLEKIYIFIEDIRDLKSKIENLNSIVEGRVKDRAIIEYYSSKNIDTKKEINRVVSAQLKLK